MQREIIVGVDRSARSRAAADWAAREARLRGMALRVVHVVPPPSMDPVEQWPYRPEAVADHVVAELTERHRTLQAGAEIITGAPAPTLLAVGKDAEVLVLGRRGEGGGAGLAVGSTAAAVAAESAAPVVLVPCAEPCEPPPGRSTGVTVGVDVRDPSAAALDFAFEAAGLRGARVHAVHSWKLPDRAEASPLPPLEEDRASWEDDEVQLLSDALRPWRRKYPDVDVLEDVLLLTPFETLTHTSESSELVVIERQPVPGSALRQLLAGLRCPVVVVPS